MTHCGRSHLCSPVGRGYRPTPLSFLYDGDDNNDDWTRKQISGRHLRPFMCVLREVADWSRQAIMFQAIGQVVVGALLCVVVTITIDAIAHPEVTEGRCNIKCAKSLHYIGRESAQLEVPDTGIPRQVLSDGQITNN